MRFAPLYIVAACSLAVPLVFVACGGKKGAQSPNGGNSVVTTVGTLPGAAPSSCKDAPVNPGDAIAKEPGVFNQCITNAGKLDPNVCGSAKIAVKIGKNGRVQDAEVAQSTLPVAVTDCIKARLGELQFACPTDDSAVYTVPVGFPVGGGPHGECPGMPGTTPP